MTTPTEPRSVSEIPEFIFGTARWVLLNHSIGMDFGEDRKERLVKDLAYAILEERQSAVEDVLSMLLCHELYKYRPSAFKGFVEYARNTLVREPVETARALQDERDGGWQDIATAPKDGSSIMLADSREEMGMVIAFYEASHDQYVWHVADSCAYHVAAFDRWRPLPRPPHAKDSEG